MNHDLLAQNIVEKVGGTANIENATHCITRLRLNVTDQQAVDFEGIKALDGVVNAQYSGGQFQVIIGPEVQDVYHGVTKIIETSNVAPIVGGKAISPKGNIINRLFDTMSGIFGPIIPAIIAGGLIKGLIAILGNFGLLTGGSHTAMVLDAIADAAFYFLPFLVAFSAAKKFRATPSLALALAGVLMYPTFINLANEGELSHLSFLGFLNLPLASYASSVIPIILGVWLLGFLERMLSRVIPKTLNIVFVPLLSLLITAPILLAFIAPLGNILGIYLDRAVTFLFTFIGPLGGAVMGGLLPLIIITGMQYAFFPGTFASFANFGYDLMLLPMSIVSNLAQAGAVFAVFLRTRDKQMKQIAFSALIPAFFGITEPAIYGVTLKLKKPFYAVLAGGAVGGALFGFFGVKAFAFTLPGILSLPTYMETGTNNFIYALLGVVASFVVAFLVAFFLNWDRGGDNTSTSQEDSSLEYQDVNAGALV